MARGTRQTTWVSCTAADGTNAVVAAQGAGKKIEVFGWWSSANAAVNWKFVDGSGGSDLTKLTYLATAGDGGDKTETSTALCTTSANTGLYANLSTTGPLTLGVIWGVLE